MTFDEVILGLGLVGIAGATFGERILPFIPSYVLFCFKCSGHVCACDVPGLAAHFA